MTRRTAFIMLDSSMLLSFVGLVSWRLTGLAAHEWIGLALIALIFAHLFVHWHWVESSLARASRPDRPVGTGRRRPIVPLLLNGALFLAMGTVLVSGLVISKVVLPNALTPDDYLRWHGLHESSATLCVVIVGLHLALNWDRIRASLRAVARRRTRAARGAAPLRLAPGAVLPRVAWILGLCALLALAVEAATRLLPSPQVVMVFPDGHQERRAPPSDIARLHPGDNSPFSPRWPGRLLGSLAIMSVAAVAGRTVLRLRLGR